MQLSSAGYLEGIRGIRLLYHQSNVDFQLLVQTLPNVTAGNVFTGLSGKRRGVDHEVHGQGRLFDVDHLHGFRMVRCTDGLADGNIRDTGYDHDIAALCFGHRHSLETPVDKDLVDFIFGNSTVFLANRNLLGLLQSTSGDAADSQSADVIVVRQRANLQLQRLFSLVRERIHVVDDGLQQRFDVQIAVTLRALFDLAGTFADDHFIRIGRLSHRDALSGNSVKNWEVQLIVVSFQIHEQLVYFVHNFVDSRVLLVDFVDEQNRVQSLLQRLVQHETGLRHRTFAGVYQKDNGIYGFHDTFYLGAEVRVSRGVHDVDFVILVHDGTVLGINGNSTFSFDGIAVHDAIHHLLVVSKYVRLRQKCVYQSRLSGINVSDNGNINYFFFFFH